MELTFLGECIWSSVSSTLKSYHLMRLSAGFTPSFWTILTISQFWKTWCSFLFYNFSLLFNNTYFYHQVLKCTLWVLDFGNVTRVCAWFTSSPLTFKSSQELLGGSPLFFVKCVNNSFHVAKVSLPAFIFLAFSVPPPFF